MGDDLLFTGGHRAHHVVACQGGGGGCGSIAWAMHASRPGGELPDTLYVLTYSQC